MYKERGDRAHFPRLFFNDDLAKENICARELCVLFDNYISVASRNSDLTMHFTF